MDLYEDPIIISPPEGACPGCSPRSSDLFYCEAKSRYCLTVCEYCRNSCPCVSRKKTGAERYK